MQRGTIYPEVISIRLSRGQADQLRQAAQEDDRPISALLRRLITTTLAEKRKERTVPVE
jgi:hypothetical protein